MSSSSKETMYSFETSTCTTSVDRSIANRPRPKVDDATRQSCWGNICGSLRSIVRKNTKEKRFKRLRNLRLRKNLGAQDEILHEKIVAKDMDDSEFPSKNFQLDGRLLTATFLPDVVIQTIKQGGLEALPSVHTYTAALMFADVTGFTALTEVYTVSGVKGIEELSKTINNYISSIVSCVLSAGGDVLKYAGDAFLCAWIAEGETDLPRIVHAATECALLIQQHHGHAETSSGVVIRIKIAIAAGKLKLYYFGILEEFVHYTIAGNMISEISDLQNECQAGDVLLSYLAWDYLQKNLDCKFIVQNDIRGFVKMQPLTGHGGELEHRGREEILQSCSTDDMAIVNMFLMPMMRNIDSSKLLDYMTELRQVTILFVCIHNIKEQAGFMEKGFSVVYGCLKEMEGIFNKGITFDKGFTFLALFGLPGYKHKYESCQALRCASRITRLLNSISIKSSIGVTTGTCFCGIMGHPHRREYTVLGRKVNMAARLMIGYANIPITCDDDTYFRSQVQLGSTSFIMLETKELKGLQNIGRVYEYKFDLRLAVGDLQQFEHPIIGFTEERREIRSALHNAFACSLSQRKMELHFVIVDGEQGGGKSRVLAWTNERAIKMGFRTLSFSPNITALHENYNIIYYMLNQLCNELFKNSNKPKEEVLKDLVPNYYHRNLFFLNEVLNVQLPPLMTALHLDAQTVSEMKEEIYSIVLEELCNTQPLAIIVDDAQFVDEASWKFLLKFLANTNTICIISLPFCPENKRKESVLKAIFEKGYLIVHLPPLKSLYIAAIACQHLNVVGIHKTIQNILQTHGKNNAVWCQELLQHLKDQEFINCVPLAGIPRLRLNSDFLYPKEEFLRMSGKELCIYDIKPGVALTEVEVPFSMQSLILQRLNQLDSHEMMILKIAAVCGNEMDIYLLHLLNPEMRHEKIANIVTKLLELCVLECGEYHSQEKMVPSKTMAKCLCPRVKCCTNTNVSCCQRPVFHSILIQDTIYKSMTTEQRLKLHQKALDCLDVIGVVCSACSKLEDFYHLDMRSCTCREQKLTINIQMAHHWNILGQEEKFLSHKQEVVKAQILLGNFQEALKLSRESTAQTQQLFQSSESTNHKILHVESIRLMAETKYFMKMSKEALVDITLAFELLGRKLPEYYVAGAANENVKASYSEDTWMEADCLNVACKIYFDLNNPKQAFVLADYHLEILSRGDKNLENVVNAYTMQLKCHYVRDRLKCEEELENHAVNWCNERLDDKLILIEEVRSIISCYSEILTYSFYRNDLKNTLNVGFRVYKITKETSDLQTQVKVLPLFAQALLFESNSVKCLEVLSQLREVAEESQSQVGLVLYYAELAELIILQDFHTKGDRLKECKEFLTEFYHKSHISTMPDIDFYLVATTTLWCLRFGLGSEDTNPDVWLKKAEMLESEAGGSYWALSGSISLLDVQVQGMRLLFQEPVSMLKATKRNLLKKLHALQRKLHLRYPVLIHRIEKIHLELKQIWELLRFMQY